MQTHLGLTASAMALGLMGTAAAAENRVDRQLPNAPELAAYGDHAVGVRTLEMTNPDQIDILSIGASGLSARSGSPPAGASPVSSDSR